MALYMLTARLTPCSHILSCKQRACVPKAVHSGVALFCVSGRWKNTNSQGCNKATEKFYWSSFKRTDLTVPECCFKFKRTQGCFFQQTRHFSAETYSKYFSPDVAPIGYAQHVLESIHSATGLPWWASIIVSTVLLRAVVTLPLAIYSMHIFARVEQLQPEIAKLSQDLRREVAMAVKKFGWDAKTARFKYNTTMRKLIRELYIRDNCHPAKSSLVMWFQIPMWICVSFALRNMSGAIPGKNSVTDVPVLCPDLQTEGALWFPDLTTPDVTWILPLILGVANLMNIEIHTLMSPSTSKFQQNLVWVMRGLSLVMVPVGAVMPSCMCLYWVCSSVFGVAQNLTFKIPTVRRLLRLPRTASESSTPFQDIYYAARDKYFRKSSQ